MYIKKVEKTISVKILFYYALSILTFKKAKKCHKNTC